MNNTMQYDPKQAMRELYSMMWAGYINLHDLRVALAML